MKHDDGFGHPVIERIWIVQPVKTGEYPTGVGPEYGRFILKHLISIFLLVAFVSSAHAQSAIKRTELKRGDLTGKDMDVIVTIVEVPPGETLGRHTHPGEEAVYVLEGATIALPDGKEIPFPTGAATLNARDVPHAGIKVVGDKPLKMLTVHIVDKGKPVTEFVK